MDGGHATIAASMMEEAQSLHSPLFMVCSSLKFSSSRSHSYGIILATPFLYAVDVSALVMLRLPFIAA